MITDDTPPGYGAIMTLPPLTSEDEALALPAVAAIYERARASSLPGAMAAENLAMILAALHDGGVVLGAYDARIADWLCGWEPQVVAVVAGWIGRAHEAGLAGEDGSDG